MAITIFSQPSPTLVAAFTLGGIIWEFTSDRFASTVHTSVPVTDNGSGFCRFTKSSHGFLVGDIITGTLYSEATYNVRHTITAKTSGTFDTDISFVSGVSGTVTRTNDRFQMRGEVKKVGLSVIGSKVQKKIDVGGSDVFRFNVANLVQTLITFNLEALGSTNIITPTAESTVNYQLILTEEFDDANGIQKQVDTLTTASTNRAINAALQYIDTQDLTAFSIPGVSRRFLTNAPKTQKIGLTEEVQLHFVNDNITDTYHIAVEKFNLVGVSTGITRTGDIAITSGRGIVPVNSTFFSASESKIEVFLEDAGNVQKSEKMTFTVDQDCFKSPVRFWFFNTIGGFDAISFTGDRTHFIRNRPTSFRKDLGITWNVKDRGDTILGSDNERRREVFSGFMKEADRIWLEEMYSTVELYIVENSKFLPVSSKSSKAKIIDDHGHFLMKMSYVLPDLVKQTN